MTLNFLIPYTIVIIVVGCLFNGMAFVVFILRGNRTGFRFHSANYNLYLGALSVWDTCVLIFNFSVGVGRALFPAFNAFFLHSQILCSCHGILVEFFNLQSAWTIVSFSVARLLTTYLPFTFTPKSQESRFFKVMAYFFITNLFFSSLKLLASGFEGNSVFKYAPCNKISLIDGGNMKSVNITGYNSSQQYARYVLTLYYVSTDIYLDVILYILVALNTWIPVMCVLTCNIFIVRKIWNTHSKIHATTCASTRINSVSRVANNNEYKNTIAISSSPNQLQSLSLKISQANSFIKLSGIKTNRSYNYRSGYDCNTILIKNPNEIRNISLVLKPLMKLFFRVKFLIKKMMVKKITPSSSAKEFRATKLLLLVSTVHLISITPIGVVQTLELVLSKSLFLKQFVITHPYILTNTKIVRIYLFALYELTFATNFIWYLIFPSNKSFRSISCIK
ncbi:unnamed protein product [Gordionus sp. m RMFG-2023]